MEKDHQYFMRRCLQLAETAAANGESAVGSVVVLQGEIVGVGAEQSRALRDITRHAEVVAVLDALKHVPSLKGAALYTNVEPCLLCSYVIRHHQIGQVFFLKNSGELGGTHQPYNLLTASDIRSWTAPPEVQQLNLEEIK